MKSEPPVITMLPDGSFQERARPMVPLQMKLIVGAVLVAAVAGSIAMAALAVWVISMVLPVLVVAAAAAWVMLKLRRSPLFGGQAAPGPQVRPGPGVWNQSGFFRK